MTKEEFIGKMFELIKDNKYVFTKVCDSFDTCDACPLCNWDNCEALMIDGLCDMIIDLQNKKAETNLEHYYKGFTGYRMVDGRTIVDMMFEHDVMAMYNQDDEWDFAKWLLQPYKEPNPLYRLRQFEYDLIKAHQEVYGDDSLLDWAFLKEWQKKGYLRNVPDDVEVSDILKNAEVIDSE